MSARERAIDAARGAVGAKFRLHGRDPRFGLDCVGLSALAMRAAGYGGPVPCDYGLHQDSAEAFLILLDAGGMARVDHPQPGDLMLFPVGPAQFHLGIKVPGGFVHADAMLRRIVERPGKPPWPVVACWRVIDEDLARTTAVEL